jgi:hypothetical protein
LVTPTSAEDADKAVDTDALLLAGAGSDVVALTVAVFTIGSGPAYPGATWNRAKMVALDPTDRTPNEHGNAVVHAPLFEMNVSPAGVGLSTETPAASVGPVFVI